MEKQRSALFPQLNQPSAPRLRYPQSRYAMIIGKTEQYPFGWPSAATRLSYRIFPSSLMKSELLFANHESCNQRGHRMRKTIQQAQDSEKTESQRVHSPNRGGPRQSYVRIQLHIDKARQRPKPAEA